MAPKMTNTVGYVRVSTAMQADDGLSMDAQRAKIRAYAQLHDLRLVHVCTDAGVSAKSLERPGLTEALAYLDEDRASALLVVKLDRLTRSVRDLGVLIERYFHASSDRSLLSVQDSIDTRTASGRMILNVLTSVSQWEREAIAERTKAVMEYKRTAGEYTGGKPPYGYAVDTRKGVQILVPNKAEREVMEIVGDMITNGETYQATANHLEAQEYPTRTGRPWSRQAVARVWARVQEENDDA